MVTPFPSCQGGGEGRKCLLVVTPQKRRSVLVHVPPLDYFVAITTNFNFAPEDCIQREKEELKFSKQVQMKITFPSPIVLGAIYGEQCWKLNNFGENLNLKIFSLTAVSKCRLSSLLQDGNSSLAKRTD